MKVVRSVIKENNLTFKYLDVLSKFVYIFQNYLVLYNIPFSKNLTLFIIEEKINQLDFENGFSKEI